MMIDLKQCAQRLTGSDSVLLLCHAHPDGDTLGSACALSAALTALDKKVFVSCGDSIPACFDFMFESLVQTEPDDSALVVAVDVADTVLLGEENRAKYDGRIDLCIDHHGSNRLFAKEVWLCPGSASTAEMIFRLIGEIGVPLTPSIASALFTGVSTDTGCFRFSNTTPDTHRIAASLIEAGADSKNIIQVFFETKSKAYSAIEKLALDEMRLYLDDRCAVMPVTRAMFDASGASENDTDRLANLPRQIEGVLVGVTLRELVNGDFKASVRTHGDVDASAICKRLGGGGHPGAAGCTLKMTKEQAISALLTEIEAELR